MEALIQLITALMPLCKAVLWVWGTVAVVRAVLTPFVEGRQLSLQEAVVQAEVETLQANVELAQQRTKQLEAETDHAKCRLSEAKWRSRAYEQGDRP